MYCLCDGKRDFAVAEGLKAEIGESGRGAKGIDGRGKQILHWVRKV